MHKSILHIDDEESIRAILAEFLTDLGYRVRSVATAREALAAVRDLPPDLVIADLQLQEADGLEAIAQLRATLPETPVILLTGVLIDPKIADATVGRLVSAYVEKTRPLAEIAAAIVRLIGPAN